MEQWAFIAYLVTHFRGFQYFHFITKSKIWKILRCTKSFNCRWDHSDINFFLYEYWHTIRSRKQTQVWHTTRHRCSFIYIDAWVTDQRLHESTSYLTLVILLTWYQTQGLILTIYCVDLGTTKIHFEIDFSKNDLQFFASNTNFLLTNCFLLIKWECLQNNKDQKVKIW